MNNIELVEINETPNEKLRHKFLTQTHPDGRLWLEDHSDISTEAGYSDQYVFWLEQRVIASGELGEPVSSDIEDKIKFVDEHQTEFNKGVNDFVDNEIIGKLRELGSIVPVQVKELDLMFKLVINCIQIYSKSISGSYTKFELNSLLDTIINEYNSIELIYSKEDFFKINDQFVLELIDRIQKYNNELV